MTLVEDIVAQFHVDVCVEHSDCSHVDSQVGKSTVLSVYWQNTWSFKDDVYC